MNKRLRIIIFVLFSMSCVAVFAAANSGGGEHLSLLQQIEIWYRQNMSYPVIAFLMALESSFLGIIPSELIVSAAAYVSLDPSTPITFWGVVISSTVGSMCGGLINYGLAIWLGRKALYAFADSRAGKFFLLSSEKLEKSEKWFVRYSKPSVCIGRVVPAVRQLISIPAGLSRMNIFSFMFYTFLGSGVWNTVLALLGYFLHGQQDLIKKYTVELSYLLVVVVLITVLFLIAKYLYNRNKQMKNQRLFGLMGYPLNKSMSKKYFTEKFEKEKINARYENFEAQNIDEIQKIIDQHPNLQGFNITFPLKEKIIPIINAIDPVASKIGAVNCVKIVRNEKEKPCLIGYNTDTYGFETAIQPYLTSKMRKALVLGTGGSAKAVTAALQRLNFEFTLVSRTKTDKTLDYSEISENLVRDNLLIINATPVGFGALEGDSVPFPFQYLTSEHLLYDLIYNPAETVFLRKGRENGAKTLNGKAMLEEQAIRAWQIWNN